MNRFFFPLPSSFLILCLTFISSFSLFSQALNGTYTIGGTSPDYADFSTAVAALNQNGISGNVNFNVRSGEYVENIKLNQISGSSSQSQIVFQAESGNPDDVVLKHMHTSWPDNSNYTVFLDGTDYITFQNLTFQAILNRDYNRVLFFQNNADYVTFNNTKIISWYENDNSFNTNDAITVKNSRNLTFSNNYIEGGHTGMYVGGIYADDNWTISNNVFNKQYGVGIEIFRGTDIDILNNTIESQDGIQSYTLKAIEISQVTDSITINGNNIYLKQGGGGINITSCRATNRKAVTISNNMITIGASSVSGAQRRGIYSSYNDTIGIYYNSINIESPGSSGEIIYSVGNDTLLLYNNMLTHHGGGKIFYSPSSSNTNLTSDYNNLYNLNQSIAQLGGSTYSTLSNLQINRNVDQNSVRIIPLYLRRNYLVPTNSSIYERGIAIQEVTEDYFGNPRSSNATDIGVFEGRVPDADVGMISTTLDNFVACPGDTFPVYATIKNFGFVPLNSVEIYLEIEDSLYNVNWTGILNRYNSVPNILVANVVVPQNNFEKWKIYTSQPNNIQDSLVVNDTLSGNLTRAAKGHFRVGSSASADFSSLEKAFEDLVKRGICDSTFLDIEAGTYDEQVIIPAISGTSASSPLIIQSLTRDSSLVLYRFYGTSSRNYIFQFENTKHTILRNISIWSRSSSYNVAIQLQGNGENIKIENNSIRGQSAGAFANRSLVNLNFGFRNTVPKDIFIRNNTFSKGGYQIYIDGYSSNQNENIVIENNQFFQGSISIYGEYFNGLEINKNKFTGYRSTCIELLNSNGPIKLTKNKFNITSNYSTNVIKINNCDGTSSLPIEISNNFIRAEAQYAYGVRLTNVNHLNLYHNNFHLNGDRYMLEFSSTITDLDSRNNIFYSSQMGKAYGTNLIITPAMFSSNYNLFFTNNSDLHDIRGTGMSLQNWQFITNYDANSISINPLYVNDTNLHVTNHIPINGTAVNLPSIIDDIDDELRNNPSDIGADEFDIDSTSYFDLELESFVNHGSGKCQPSDSIFVSVVNHSNFTIDSFYTKWGVLGRRFDSTKHYISILSGDTVDVFVGKFKFRSNTFYNLDVQIVWPNGNVDNTQSDNRKILNYERIDSLRINSKNSNYCSADTELFIENFPNQSILWSTGGVENSIQVSNPGTYSITVVDNNGCVLIDSITIP